MVVVVSFVLSIAIFLVNAYSEADRCIDENQEAYDMTSECIKHGGRFDECKISAYQLHCEDANK